MGNTSFRRSAEEVIQEQDEGNGDVSTAAPVCINVKVLDANRYATKKTVAQGMLDIALLTSNASQLKYVLQVGQRHEFYTLLITLISVSLVLQVTSGVIYSILASSLNINKPEQQRKADILNNICLSLNVIVLAVNSLIGVFYMLEQK